MAKIDTEIKLKKIRSFGKRILRFLKENDAYADIYLVSDKEIHTLNKKFRDKDKATNVLSFPFPKDFPQPVKGKRYLGEVYLCESYIKEHGEDINFMLVHGILHLLGFNHIKKSDRIEMEGLEKKIMDGLAPKSF